MHLLKRSHIIQNSFEKTRFLTIIWVSRLVMNSPEIKKTTKTILCFFFFFCWPHFSGECVLKLSIFAGDCEQRAKYTVFWRFWSFLGGIINEWKAAVPVMRWKSHVMGITWHLKYLWWMFIFSCFTDSVNQLWFFFNAKPQPSQTPTVTRTYLKSIHSLLLCYTSLSAGHLICLWFAQCWRFHQTDWCLKEL